MGPKKKKIIILIAVLIIILLGSIASIFFRPYTIARQQIPKEEKIVKVLRADTTGDGQKEILAAASRTVVGKAQSWNEVDIHVIQRMGPKDIRKWRLSTGEVFENVIIEDINKDGKVEIVAFSLSGNMGTIDIFTWDGSTYKKIFVNGAKGGIELKDTDSDEIKEILLKGTGYGSSTENYIYKWDGKKYYLWKTEKIKT